jgi:glutaconate CoA-transferase, subunit B
MPDRPYSDRELLIAVLARRLPDHGHVVAGAISPIPAAAAMLARERSGERLRITVLGSERFYRHADGGREIFDAAGRGRVDVFFLSGGQIDGNANINLVGVGEYPDLSVRFHGNFGSAYLYYMVPNVILFREEHSPRVLVPKVEFISAPGSGPEGIYRPGGPSALVTSRAIFGFNKATARFGLESLHPGHDLEEVEAATGFTFAHAAEVPSTSAPSDDELTLIRGPVREMLAETYPEVAATLG